MSRYVSGKPTVAVAMLLLFCVSVGCEGRFDPRNFGRTLTGQPQFGESAELNMFNSLKDKCDMQSLYEASGSETPFVLPEDANKYTEACMNFFLSEPKLTTVFSFPSARTKSRLSVNMDNDGTLFYIIDTDNTIHVIDLESGETKQEFKSPIEASYGIVPDAKGEHVFVANLTEMVKVNLVSHEVVGKISGLPSELLDWDRALDADAMAAYTVDSKLMYIDGEFKGFEIMPDLVTKAKSVAINPEGKYIIGADGSKLFRWHVSETPHRVESLKADFFDFNYMPVTCDYDADRWFDFGSMHEYYGERHTQAFDVFKMQLPFLVNLSVTDAVTCSTGRNSWATMVGIIPDGTTNKKYVLGSVRWRPNTISENSAFIKLDAPIARLLANRTGGRVVLVAEPEVKVCDRPYFDDYEGETTWFALGKLIYQDQVPALEYCANYLRGRNWPDKLLSGEDVYSQIIDRLGVEWSWSELNPNGATVSIPAMEKWKASGNEMAILASAERHIEMGWEARGGGFANEVTAVGAAELDRRAGLAEADLDELLKLKKPPAKAFQAYITVQKLRGDSYKEGMQTVKRCMQIYPEFMPIHGAMAMWLLPRWGGPVGAVHIYADKIASEYPSDLQDQVYANILLQLFRSMAGHELHKADESNADVERVFRGGDDMIKRNQLKRVQCEELIRLAAFTNDTARAKTYSHFHLTHFTTPTHLGQRSALRDQFVLRKYENLRQTAGLKTEAAKQSNATGN